MGVLRYIDKIASVAAPILSFFPATAPYASLAAGLSQAIPDEPVKVESPAQAGPPPNQDLEALRNAISIQNRNPIPNAFLGPQLKKARSAIRAGMGRGGGRGPLRRRIARAHGATKLMRRAARARLRARFGRPLHMQAGVFRRSLAARVR